MPKQNFSFTLRSNQKKSKHAEMSKNNFTFLGQCEPKPKEQRNAMTLVCVSEAVNFFWAQTYVLCALGVAFLRLWSSLSFPVLYTPPHHQPRFLSLSLPHVIVTRHQTETELNWLRNWIRCSAVLRSNREPCDISPT